MPPISHSLVHGVFWDLPSDMVKGWVSRTCLVNQLLSILVSLSHQYLLIQDTKVVVVVQFIFGSSFQSANQANC